MNINEKVKNYLDRKQNQEVEETQQPNKKHTTKKQENKAEWAHLKLDLTESKVETVERLAKEFQKPVYLCNPSTCSSTIC